MEWILEYMGRVRTPPPLHTPLPLLLRRPLAGPVPLLLILQAGGKGPPFSKQQHGRGDDGAGGEGRGRGTERETHTHREMDRQTDRHRQTEGEDGWKIGSETRVA